MNNVISNRKCIRSMRIAKALMQQGFAAVDTEPSRQSQGFIVWVFECTSEFEAALSDIMRDK